MMVFHRWHVSSLRVRIETTTYLVCMSVKEFPVMSSLSGKLWPFVSPPIDEHRQDTW